MKHVQFDERLSVTLVSDNFFPLHYFERKFYGNKAPARITAGNRPPVHHGYTFQ